MKKEGTDLKATVQWLTDRLLDAETEGRVISAQEEVTHTRAYLTRVLKEAGTPKCRACGEGEETVGHMLSACPTYAWTLYNQETTVSGVD